MSTREYYFPYNRIKKGEKVVIAGAGKVGCSFIDQVLDSGYCEIAGVIDRAYKTVGEVKGIKISPYEALEEMQYHHIILAATPQIWPDILKDLMAVDAPLSKCIVDIYTSPAYPIETIVVMKEDDFSSFLFQTNKREAFLEQYSYLREKYGIFERELNQKVRDNPIKEIGIEGFCSICGETSRFVLDLKSSIGTNVNFRERIQCPKCKLRMRMRYLASRLLDLYQTGQKVYAYERITDWYKVVSEKIGEENITGSEYFGELYQSGDKVNGILHEDAMKLSFADETFDIIVSNDVFEHVADYKVALSESSRVLKHNGKMLLSIPFDIEKEKTEIRAKIVDGEIIHLKTPAYHGNPLDSKGSLVFTDFGWDLLDVIKECGFSDVNIVLYYDIAKGYFGGMTYYFELEK